MFEHKNTEPYNEYYTITDFYSQKNNTNDLILNTFNSKYHILGMKNEKKLLKLLCLFDNIFRNHYKNIVMKQKYKYIINKYNFYSLIIFTGLAFLFLFIKQHKIPCCHNYGI